jgi:hypothetical protein
LFLMEPRTITTKAHCLRCHSEVRKAKYLQGNYVIFMM